MRESWTYDDEDVDTIVTYNDASVSLDAGSGDWVAGTAATYEVTDSDANRSPGDDETLEIYDETVQIPTIKMGSPLTIAGNTGDNTELSKADSNSNTGVTVGSSVPFSDSSGTLTLQNVDAIDATTEATLENAIDSLANLVTVGTITSGTWEGTAIAVNKGGTGLTAAGTSGFIPVSNGSAWVMQAIDGGTYS